MSTEIDRRLAELRAGRPPKGALSREHMPELFARLAEPARGGLELVHLIGELQQLMGGGVLTRLASRILDTGVPRVARARFARLFALAPGDPERWPLLTKDLPGEDFSLAMEGCFELIFTVHATGMPEELSLAAQLSLTPPGRMEELAPTIDPVRRHVGARASQVYRDVFDDAALRPFWPHLAPALAEEASPDALAALDLALLRAPASPEAEAVRKARAALLDRAPSVRATALPTGEVYLCPPDDAGRWTGAIALREGAACEVYSFTFVAGGTVALDRHGTLPTEAVHAFVKQSVFPRALELPLAEALAFLRAAAPQGKEGSDVAWAGLEKAFRAAPELSPLEPGEPLSNAEIEVVLAEDPALWHLEPDASHAILQALLQISDGKGPGNGEAIAFNSLRLEATVHWLVWTGRPELAARISAHCLRIGEREANSRFLAFLGFWAMRASKRFVEETEAKKKKR